MMRCGCYGRIALLLLLPLSGVAKPFVAIQHWQTAQGVPVLFVENHALPIVDLQINFDVGSARDGQQPGIAQFTGAMLDEGTTRLTADDIADRFDENSGLFSVNVDRDRAVLHCRSLTFSEYFDNNLNTVMDLLSHAVFPLSNFMRVRMQLLTALDEESNYPDRVAHRRFYELLYGKQPYGHAILGTKDSIQAMQPKDLVAFYRTYYVSGNASIALVGDIDLNRAKQLAERLVNSLPVGDKSQSILSSDSIVHAPASIAQRIEFPSQQTHVYIGQIGIDWHDPDYFPLLVGNYILGGKPLTSLLFQEVRNRAGLVYSVGSYFEKLQAKGPFLIVLQTNQPKEALDIVRSVLHQFMTEGPSEVVLKSAKRSLVNSFPLSVSSNAQLIDILGRMVFYHLPLNYLDSYAKQVNAVTIDDIKLAFNRHIDLNKMLTVTVGSNG